VPVPGRARRADLLDACFLGGTAAHGIELDDGYTKGSVHPGCTVIPAALTVGYATQASGKALIEAIVAGYETATAIGRSCHPALRHRGFHPTGAVSVFGAAMAAGKLRGLSARALTNAMGIAASSSAGLFAFVNGGADIKRLHAGHAAREGVQAALLAEQGVEGPPGVIEARDGFMQAFAYASPDEARPITLPPEAPFGVTDCYVKPNPCCRHIQPATEALIALLKDEGIATDEVKHVAVETYRIAAEHAATGWDDFASSQLSFPYLMVLALKHRAIRFEHFSEAARADPANAMLAAKIHVSAPAEIDRLYPRLRPARVTVTTARGKFTRQADEALGSRLVPLDDDGLKGKFHDLVAPALGDAAATNLAAQLWTISNADDVRPIIEATTKPSP
jgi:2-methylcitrate dehydratase PrpD